MATGVAATSVGSISAFAVARQIHLEKKQQRLGKEK
jgi:hypothetical protein